MPRDIQNPVADEDGRETHPAFGQVRINRVSGSASLFGSEVMHHNYVVLTVRRAERTRDLHRDWVYEREALTEIAFSEAQWAQAISSLNSGATECTIQFVKGEGTLPGIPFEPRLALSRDEAVSAATRAFDKIVEAYNAFMEKPNAANKRALGTAIDHVRPNIEFAAQSLAEHTEDVVTKARVDIEAMVYSAAKAYGLPEHMRTEMVLGMGLAEEPREIESGEE